MTHDTVSMPPGEQVAWVRRKAGLTQADLAARIGIPLWKVDQLERSSIDVAPFINDIELATSSRIPVSVAASGAVMPAPHRPPLFRGTTARRDVVLALLAILILLRFFTEVISVLPRSLTFIDIPLFFALVAASVLAPRSAPLPRELRIVGGLSMAFSGLVLISALVNLRRVEAAPALLFLYTVVSGPLVGIAVYRMWPGGQARPVVRFLFVLGVIQLLVVLFIDIPRFLPTNNPDVISGTFGQNGYQLVFFLLVLLGVLSATLVYDPESPIARFAAPMMGASAVVIFLVQYRSLLLTIALTLLLMGYFLRYGRARGVLVGMGGFLVVGAALLYVSSAFGLKYSGALETIRSDPLIFVKARGEVLSDVGKVYGDEPRSVLVGTGPGTFSSRAYRTFSIAEAKEKAVQFRYAARLTGNRAYSTDVADRYTLVRLLDAQTNAIDGSVNFTQPWMSYAGFAAETGLPGVTIVAVIYLLGLALACRLTVRATSSRPPGALPAVALGATVSFFVLLQLGFFEQWLESTRITFLAWTLLAIAAKEAGTLGTTTR